MENSGDLEMNGDVEQTMSERPRRRMKRVDQQPVGQSWGRGIRPTNWLLTMLLVGIAMGLFGLMASRDWFKTGLVTKFTSVSVSAEEYASGEAVRREVDKNFNALTFNNFSNEMRGVQGSTAAEINRLNSRLNVLIFFFFMMVFGLVYVLLVLAKRVTEAESDRARLMLQLDSLHQRLTQSNALVDNLNSKVSVAQETVAKFGGALERVQPMYVGYSERLSHAIELAINLFSLLNSRAPEGESEEQRQEREKRENSDYFNFLASLKEMVMVPRRAVKLPPPLTEKDEAGNL